MRGLFRFLFNMLRLFVRTFDILLRTVFYAGLVFVAGMLLALLLRPGAEIDADSVLLLRPSGILAEQPVFEQPFDLLAGDGSRSSDNVLADLLQAIEQARDDERIRALVVETDELLGGGVSKLAELRDAIEDFRRSGKPVLARGERFTQSQYYLASAADEVHLSPDGFILLHGLARYGAYFKEALDRLGIKVHVFRAGEYKSFAEPFTRSDMSEEDRQVSLDLLQGLWGQLRDQISHSRKLDAAAVERHVNEYDVVLAGAGGNGALAAQQAGLVDQLSTRDQWEARLAERLELKPRQLQRRSVRVSEYLAATAGEKEAGEAEIAVLVAQGTIVDGRETVGVVGGDAFAQLIRNLRQDKRVKAIVLRLDSPGGSAWASELIRRELELTREAGKPVIASMSSVAASGAFWIASGADEVWASPATLTGSIGVFALFPELAEPLQRLGIGIDGVATAPLAGALDPRRELSVPAARTMQLNVDHTYERFLDVVGKARGLSREETDAVARGRVWLGTAAHELGLVDHLGGLQEAVAAAAARAGLEHYAVVWPEVALPLRERLLRKLSGLTTVQAGLEHLLPAAPALLELVRTPQQFVRHFNDPRHLYLHCLCDAP